jgi:hypothetical protein
MDTVIRIIVISVLAGTLGSQVDFDHRPAEATQTDRADVHSDAGTGSSYSEARLEPLVFDEATPDHVELVTRAVATHEAAGLELPPLTVTFGTDRDTCKGNLGLFRADTRATIRLCTGVRTVVLHELAHAWEWNALDDSARDEFVSENDLPTWNSRDHEWEERGVELMADTIAMGLILIDGNNNPMAVPILCSFEMITGRDHPALTDGDRDGKS